MEESKFVGTFTIGQTIDRGILLYKQTIGKTLILLLAPCLLGITNMKSMFHVDPAHPFAVFGPLYFLAIIIGFWSWIIIIRYLYRTSLGEKLEFGAIIRLAKGADFLLIVSGIIWYLLMIVSTLLLLVPVIYVSNLCMVGMIVVIVERKYFFNGIGRTFSLTKGRWWKTFMINAVTFAIVLGPTLAGAFFLFGSTFRAMAENPQAFSTTGMMPDLSMATIIGFVLYMLVIVLIYPLLGTISIVHYNSLRSEKENVDLDRQLDSLGAPAEKNA